MNRDLQSARLASGATACKITASGVGHWAASLGWWQASRASSNWLTLQEPSGDPLRLLLQDGLVVETVGIPASHGSRDRLTVCVSSQVCTCVVTSCSS